jgi:hypothetical protein
MKRFKQSLKCIYYIYKYDLLKEVISYVIYKKQSLDNKPSFVIEWNIGEFKKHTSDPRINQDNPYTEKTHKLNHRLSEVLKEPVWKNSEPISKMIN